MKGELEDTVDDNIFLETLCDGLQKENDALFLILTRINENHKEAINTYKNEKIWTFEQPSELWCDH